MSKRQLTLRNDDGPSAVFEMRDVKRESLYGSRQRVWLDETGKPCSWGQITSEGVLVRSGMLGTFTPPGPDVALVPSSHDEPPAVVLSTAYEFLKLAVEKVYELNVLEMAVYLQKLLGMGQFFQTKYNLSATEEPADAFLVANEHGLFLLVGRIVEPRWIQPEEIPVFDDDDSELDDNDFESLV